MAETNSRKYRGNVYSTYGNAAVRTAPDRRQQVREEQKYREELLRRVREAEREERSAQWEYSPRQIAVFAVAILTVAVLLGIFMIQLSGNYRFSSELEQQKTKYQQLVRDNALLADKIDRQTDYAAVYRYAVETLGMQAPESQQIVYYQRSSNEHVEFRGVIPNE